MVISVMLISSRVSAQVTADFTTSTPSACGSLQVSFFDQSTSTAGAIIDYSWDLGIANSSLQNPGAIYTNPGAYTICLTVTDIVGNQDTECKNDLIQIFPNPVASFEVDVAEGCAPVTAIFENTSTSANGPITSFLWDVGGSANIVSTDDANEDITTTYDAPGSYSASLIVVDSAGCQDVYNVADLVEVNGLRPVTLEVEVVEACELPWIIQFRNLTSDPDVKYTWDFGNGQVSNEVQPQPAIYSQLGSFDLTVYLENGSCADTFTFDNVVNTELGLGIIASAEQVCLGSAVDFSSSSLITVDSILWLFGDGATSTDAEPSHTYAAEGCYTVSQISYINTCQDTSVLNCINVLPAPQVSYSISNQFTCDLPAQVDIQGVSTAAGQWMWSIPELGEQSGPSATFNITDYGSYYASLNFNGVDGCVYTEDSILIDVQPFEAVLPELGPEGCVPLEFTLDYSTSSSQPVVDWQWSIGGGQYTSDLENPTLTIPDTGRYDVQLIVTNAIGCMDTVFLRDYIKVGDKVEVDFVGSPLTGCKDLLRNFQDLTIGNVDYWEWQFGTDEIILGQNPSLNLDNTGTIDVSLTVYQNGCPSYLLKPDYITIWEPDASFALEYNCDDPYQVLVNHMSTGADSIFWEIESQPGSGLFTTSTDSVLSPLIFPERGAYAINLYTENFTTGCTDLQGDTVIISDPVASYGADTLRGCAPLTIEISDLSQDAISYEYITDAVIDTTNILAATVTYTESGLVAGPLLVITDIHQCRDSFQLSDTVLVNDVVAGIDYNDIVCVPGEEIYVDTSVSLLGTIVEWNWSVANGAKTDTASSTNFFYETAGTYDLSLTVVDDWGCSDSIYLADAVTAIDIEPDFTVDSIGCTFAPIQFIAMGSADDVDGFLWDFGDGSQSSERNPQHYYATEGTYDVCLTLIDSRGCEETTCEEAAVLIQDPVAEFTGDPLFSTCPPLLTEFTNTSTNAVSYRWDFGDQSGVSVNESPSRVYTNVGTFDVMLIAEWTAACKDTLLKEDYVVVEGPDADFNVDFELSCIPQPITLQASSAEPYDYVWDYGNGVLDSVGGLVTTDTTVYEYTEPGTYAPKLIITDDKGCTRSFSGEAIRVDEVILDFSVEDSIICGSSTPVQLLNNSTSTTEAVTYEWLLSGPVEISSLEEAPQISVADPGTYNAMLIAMYGGCVDTLAVPEIFQVGAVPMADFVINTPVVCADVDISVTNTSTIVLDSLVQYTWLLPNGETSIEAEPLIPVGSEVGTYSLELIAVSNLGCQDSAQVNFEVSPSSIADAGPDILICSGESAILQAMALPIVPGGQYYWEADTDLSCTQCTSPTAQPSDTTTYYYTAVHPSGCVSTDSIVVMVAPEPAPDIELEADSLICLGSSATITVLDYNPAYTYLWNPFQPGLDCYSNCQVITATPTTTTAYEVGVLNQYGCQHKDTVVVEVEDSYTEFVTDRRAVCEGEQLVLEVLSGTDPEWLGANLSCSTCDSPTAAPQASSYYTVSVSSPLGCRYTDSIWVEVIPPTSVDAGLGGLICAGESISLFGVGFGEVTWQPEELVNNSEEPSTTATLETTTYMVLTAVDDACTLRDSVLVEVLQKAEITTIGDTICPGEEAVLTSEGMIDKVAWYYAGSELSEGESYVVNTDTTTNFMAVGHYRSCESDTSVATVYVHPQIDYELSERSYAIYLNDEVILQPAYDSTRQYVYDWQPTDGLSCSDCAAPEISGLMQSVDYVVEVWDAETGCYKALDVDVNFINRCNKDVFGMANIFAPGRVGQNSTFGPSTDNVDEFVSITIFDRWGTKLFFSDDLDVRWDGRYAGQLVGEGVYIYLMELVCPETSEQYLMPGDVTVVR